MSVKRFFCWVKGFVYNGDFYFEHLESRKTSVIHPSATLSPTSFVAESEVAEGCVLNSTSRLSRSQLGRFTYIQHGSVVSDSEVGRYCSIASNVTIGPGEHPTNCLSTHPEIWSSGSNLDPAVAWHKRTSIGHDVWVGQNAVIRAGVQIGNGAIIGAGAVVVQNVRNFEVVGGVPAKRIRFRFPEPIVQRLEELRWWDFPHALVKRAVRGLSDSDLTIEKITELEKIFANETSDFR